MKKILLTLVVMGLLLLGVYFMLNMGVGQKSGDRVQPSDVPKPVSNKISKVEQGEELSAVVEIPIETSISGNDKLAKVTVGDRDDGVINIRRHTYGIVHSTEELDALEDTITYVLFPRNLSGYSTHESPIYKRYLQVLELIQELRQVDIYVSKPKAMMHKMENQFILFGTSDNNNSHRVTVENYNYALSHRVLDFFQEKYPDVAFSDEGPYLITTAKNVLTQRKDFSFLYVNLSSFNNSSVKEVIESYKKRLIDKGNSEVNILEGWRLTLLSALTTLNADIHIVQTAMAGEL